MLNIIPWIEFNRENTAGWVTSGLKDWAKVVYTAIVSTMPGLSHLYLALAEAVPNCRIIAGLKPNGGATNLLPTFDDVAGWAKVAEEVRLVRAASGSSTILLELEMAVKAYWNGQQDIDLGHLADGLRYLPEDLNYIWYPSIKAHGFPYYERHKAVCEVAASVLGRRVRFTDRSVESPTALDDWWMVRAHRTLMGLSMTPTMPMMYAYEEPKIRWPTDEFPEAFEHIEADWGPDADVILYPGGSNWNKSAAEIVPALEMYQRMCGRT